MSSKAENEDNVVTPKIAGDAVIESGNTKTAAKKKNGKPILILITVVMVVGIAFAYFYLNYQKQHFVKTDNASVQCDMITVPSKMSGQILEVKAKQGDYVHKGDVLMTIDPAIADSTQMDNSYIRSPIDGIVLKTIGSEGQTIATGQTTVYIASDTNNYIVCNIDERDINKIKLGQDVDITIDQFKKENFYGKVSEVGTATLSAFSVVSSSSSGSFIKSVQNVPVKIQFVQDYDRLLVGANTTVKIHIK